jgi:hypothetical protein
VWAIDFVELEFPIDGLFPYLLSIRDLASGDQLTWRPVRGAAAHDVWPVACELFAEHGPPLVLKSDNGSAFIAEELGQALLQEHVAQLFSPPRYPQYNGSLERANGVLQTYTQQHAVLAGHAFRWTTADLEHARQLANTVSRPWGRHGLSPEQAWEQRQPIEAVERAAFQAAWEEQRLRAACELGLDPFVAATNQRHGLIDLVALIAAGEQAGASGDGVGMGIVFDGPHLAGQIGGRDDVDAGNGHQQHVGCLDQITGDVAFQRQDLLGFLGEIVVQVGQDALPHQGVLVRRIGVLGPGQDAEQRGALKADTLLLEQLRQPREACGGDLSCGGVVSGDGQGQRAVPEVAAVLAEQVGVAGQVEMHMLADLAAQGHPFVDEVASMADQQLELAMGRFEGLLR